MKPRSPSFILAAVGFAASIYLLYGLVTKQSSSLAWNLVFGLVFAPMTLWQSKDVFLTIKKQKTKKPVDTIIGKD